MFHKNKRLQTRTGEVHTMDASINLFEVDDLEIYMIKEISTSESHDIIIDSNPHILSYGINDSLLKINFQYGKLEF